MLLFLYLQLASLQSDIIIDLEAPGLGLLIGLYLELTGLGLEKVGFGLGLDLTRLALALKELSSKPSWNHGIPDSFGLIGLGTQTGLAYLTEVPNQLCFRQGRLYYAMEGWARLSYFRLCKTTQDSVG